MLVINNLKLLLFSFLILITSNDYSFSNELDENKKLNEIESCLSSQNLKIDKSRARKLELWKNKIIKYSEKHYGDSSWSLEPKAIILHYTVSKSFPWNLVNTNNFANEEPGLASHYVIDKTKIWEILPPNIRSRGAYGINHVGINIEMVAMNENDLFKQIETLNTTANLVNCLMKNYSVTVNKIYSHEDVAKMNNKIVPEVKDLIYSKPYGKIDPGKINMEYIKNKIKSIK